MRWRPCQEKQTYTGEVVEYQKKLMAFGLMYKHVVAAWFSEPTTETILRKPATKARRPKTGGADTNGNNKGSGGVGAGQTGGADTNGNNNDSGGVGAGQTGGADTNGNNNDSGGLGHTDAACSSVEQSCCRKSTFTTFAQERAPQDYCY